MQEDTHYLYKITNLVNGKLYIGVTNNPIKRKAQHFTKSKKNRLVNKAVEKYGKENFSFEVLCLGLKDYIYKLESKAIISYNSDAKSGYGYNLCAGGLINNQINKGKSVYKRSDDKSVYVSGWWFPNKRTSLKTLKWGDGIFNSRKKEGALGKTYYVKKRSGPQEFVYVTGFWFPSKKSALEHTTLSPNIYEKRRRNGTLWNVSYSETRKSNSTALLVPNYYKGFWFPELVTASILFNKTPESIRQQILRGVFEENSNIKKERPSRNYMAEGLEFKSLDEASLSLNISATTIKNRISKGFPNYGYTYSTKG